MYPRYSKDVLQYHVLKLREQGFTRAEINQRVDINLNRLFNDNSYFQSKSADVYKIVKLLHETDYHTKKELPETLMIVAQPASFNAYLLNSKNALDMFDKLISFNSACSPGNYYGWREDNTHVEFYIRQHEKEMEYCTTQGMIFYVVLMLKRLLGEYLEFSVGASSESYPDLKTFTQFATHNISFNQPDSFIRLDKNDALKQNNTFNENVAEYLKNQFQAQFSVGDVEEKLASLITADIRHAVRSEQDARFFNVDFISARFGLSRSTLYRKLHASNTSFTDIIDTFRKEESAQLLKNGFMPLEEISAVLGYSNLTAFNRAFRRWYNTSPAKFRNQL